MKKIIAMLLCVALVASMGISAFAAGPFTVLTSTDTFGDLYKEIVADAKAANAALSDLSKYAKELSQAKKDLADAKKLLGAVKADAVNAAQTAYTYAVATAYEAAAAKMYEDATKAIAQFYFDFVLDLAGGDVTLVPDALPAELAWLN